VRAVLIVNPNATSTTPAGRDLLAHALESRVRLTVAHTDRRGHAIDIARPLLAGRVPAALALHLAVLLAYAGATYFIALALTRRRLLK